MKLAVRYVTVYLYVYKHIYTHSGHDGEWVTEVEEHCSRWSVPLRVAHRWGITKVIKIHQHIDLRKLRLCFLTIFF